MQYKRGRKRRPKGLDCEITRWSTECGGFAVERVRSLLTWVDKTTGKRLRLSDRYLALRLGEHPDLISRHRTRSGAERSILKASSQ